MIRIAAWRCLRADPDAPLRAVDAAAAEAGLDARDRGLVRAIVGTEVRRRGTLRALVAHLVPRRPSAELAAHLRLGLAQLLFLDRVPDHAAVSETVDAAARTVGFTKGRFVNAVLRAGAELRRPGTSGDPRRDLVGRDLHLAEPVFRDPGEHPLLWAEDALSVPAPLYKRWVRRLGEDVARQVAAAALEEPWLSIRAAGVARDALAAELRAAEVDVRPGRHPRLLVASPAAAEAVLAAPAFREGRATVQGRAALVAAELVGAREGERVLDLCAAPGGKTAVLAEAGARVLSVDDDPARLARLRETVARLGHAARVEVVRADGAGALRGSVDAALVDAPCSNTGVLAARPGARWRFGPKAQRDLGALQERLLAEAADRVRPGGRLVWSTCSLEPEENGHLVRAFLERRPDWELADERETLPLPAAAPDDPDGGGGPSDGGYAARLVRREVAAAPPRR